MQYIDLDDEDVVEELFELFKEARDDVDRKYKRGEEQVQFVYYNMGRGFLMNWLNNHDFMFDLKRELEGHKQLNKATSL